MKSNLSVTIDSQLFQKIDKARAREKRSTFIEHLLKLGLEAHLQDVITTATHMARELQPEPEWKSDKSQIGKIEDMVREL